MELSLKSGVKKNAVDDGTCDRKKGNKAFQRWEYWGYEDLYLIHYTGNHEVFTPFKHRGAKNSRRPYIRSAPYVVNQYFKKVIIISSKVQGSNALSTPKAIHVDIINSDAGGPRHAVNTPRDIKQVNVYLCKLCIMLLL